MASGLPAKKSKICPTWHPTLVGIIRGPVLPRVFFAPVCPFRHYKALLALDLNLLLSLDKAGPNGLKFIFL